MLEWMETDFVWGGGRIGFFVVVVLMLFFFLTNSLYSALEHFWPIVAKSC